MSAKPLYQLGKPNPVAWQVYGVNYKIEDILIINKEKEDFYVERQNFRLLFIKYKRTAYRLITCQNCGERPFWYDGIIYCQDCNDIVEI